MLSNETLQGLILKYQFMLANSMGGRAAAAGSDGAVNAQRMRALEGQVLQAKMESNESKEDAAKASGNPSLRVYIGRGQTKKTQTGSTSPPPCQSEKHASQRDEIAVGLKKMQVLQKPHHPFCFSR